MCSVAKSLNHEGVVEVIRWFYLLPFDFPIRSCKLSRSDQEILKEWDKTLEKFSHDENDKDYGELIKDFAHNQRLKRYRIVCGRFAYQGQVVKLTFY
jgi:hypothetical protein